MQHLAAKEYVRTRWKNGAGETAQIAIFPPDAGLDDFIWRISMATIAADGPFSLFPGIDRSILALAGQGCRLRWNDGEHLLRTGDHAFRFVGETPIEAVLIDGPVMDFNVMTRRGSARHGLKSMQPGDVARGDSGAMVFALTEAWFRLGPHTIAMANWDLLILDQGESTALAGGTALAISLALDGAYNGGE